MSEAGRIESDAAFDDLTAASKALSWILLLGFFFVSSAARALYSSHGVTPSNRFEVVCAIGFITFVWYWLKEQCAPHRAAFPLDIAIFASSFPFVVLPYYLWRYERWRGLAKVAALVCAYIASYVCSVVLHYVLVWTSE